jgi:hypothetical protein
VSKILCQFGDILQADRLLGRNFPASFPLHKANMPDNIPDNSDNRGLDAQRMRLAEMARVLSLSGPKPVTLEMLEADIAAGAPTNADGTLNLIHFTAWMAKELKNGGD